MEVEDIQKQFEEYLEKYIADNLSISINRKYEWDDNKATVSVSLILNGKEISNDYVRILEG